MDKKFKFSIWYLIFAFWILIMVQELYVASKHLDEVPYSQFKTWVLQDKVAEVAITETVINGKLKVEVEGMDPQWFKTIRVDDPDLVRLLEEHQVEFAGVVVSTLWKDVASLGHPYSRLCGDLVLAAPSFQPRCGRRVHADWAVQGQDLHGARCPGLSG